MFYSSLPLCIFSILLLATFSSLSPANAQPDPSPIVIPRGCRNRCYRVRSAAFHDCRYRSRPVSGCEIARCVFNPTRSSLGWACAPIATSPTPTPSPPPSPIVIPRGCRDRCYRMYSSAFHDCRYRSRPVSGCEIARCKVNPTRAKLGWVCQPSNPSTPPSPSPSPSSQPDEDNFVARTFLRDVRLSDDSVEPAVDGSGANYRIVYDATVTNRGVVSLTGVSDWVSVTCSQDGSVRIRLEDDAPNTTPLADMYPINSVLVIDRAVFGECLLSEPIETLPGETETDRQYREASDKSNLFTDAFLLIQTVRGTSGNALVSGTPVSYFDLFDSAVISVTPVLSTSTSVATSSASRAVALPTSSRALNLNFESDLLSLGPLKLRMTGKGTYLGEFVSFRAEWSWRSMDIELKFIDQWSLNVNLDARLSGSATLLRKEWELLSIPLYGIPSIDILKKLDNDYVGFPSLKFGVYFEIPLVVRISGKIEKKLANIGSYTYTTARSEVTLYSRGSYLSIDIGSETKTLAPSNHNFALKPELTANERTEITFTLFAGIRPQFALYLAIFSSRISIEAGLEIEAMWDASAATGYPPLAPSGLQFGRCSECHDVVVNGKGKIQNANIYAKIGVDITLKKFRNATIPLNKILLNKGLPGNPSLTVDIASACFIEPVGDDGPLVFIADKKVCEACPEDKPKYNPTRQECEEECTDPDKPFFNKATEMCEACPDETPTYNKKLEICEGKCPGGTRAGNDVPFYGSFELGRSDGVFTFRREHYTVRDRMQVFYEGSVILDTGCTGGFSTSNLRINGTATNVVVNVIPNCQGTSGTAWWFTVSCPV